MVPVADAVAELRTFVRSDAFADGIEEIFHQRSGRTVVVVDKEIDVFVNIAVGIDQNL